ncbi:biopolymer transport protein ExbB [Monaibacterium marinum]|uniref:Biopolymer transport protein ExbB n=2 Tax=Pontivivens marinum TaxID=1690039 RepID=A0A2C9CR33_9RHOB|nr:biopolymer transport protein ExbB [Monaibacterium marinum]
MNLFMALHTQMIAIYQLGGPVVAILIGLSIISLSMILWKLWQFGSLGVGRHREITQAIAYWDTGADTQARAALARSRNRLAECLSRGDGSAQQPRIEAEASVHLSRLEGGFRALDIIAQSSPLLGLFGTVLGMIDAFQALQDAGNSVDPSLLAGGIWVALLTTAAGLAVAMPTSLALTFFDGRVAGERTLAETAIAARFAPMAPTQVAA